MTLKRTLKALSVLLPASALGASAALASTAAAASLPPEGQSSTRAPGPNTAQRLQLIRTADNFGHADPDQLQPLGSIRTGGAR